jgi:hypothetical protein
MQRTTVTVPDQTLLAADADPQLAEVLRRAEGDEWYHNDRYTARAHRAGPGGPVDFISVRRNDRKPVRDWRDLQRIKRELAGDVEAIELYPAEARVVDTANQYWLWCFPPGVTLPVGFADGMRSAGADPRFPASVQRPFDEEENNE